MDTNNFETLLELKGIYPEADESLYASRELYKQEKTKRWDLELELQAYKKRWEKLKEYIAKRQDEFNSIHYDFTVKQRTLLREIELQMQELEKEGKDEE